MRSATKMLATSLLFLFVLTATGQTDSVEAKLRMLPTGSGGSRRVISSGELRVAINDIDGRFTIGTIEGKSLLFGFPHEGGTSHTHFFVNDSVAGTYTDDGGLHPDAARVLTHPFMVGDAVVSRYEIDGIEFEQRLTPTILGEHSTVLIEYIATNRTSITKDAGLLLFLDTMIGENDYAPIATEYGYFSVEREFISPSIPTYWQAFESSPWQPPDSLIGSGVIIGGSAVPPDRIVYGDFWNFHDIVWDYIIEGDPFSDSAILMRWDADPLMPGETRRMATYYGLGSVEIVVGDLNLSLSAPDELTIESCSFRSPVPFPVNLLVSNGTGVILGALEAKIDLPEGFRVEDGDAVVDLMPDVLGPGGTGAVSWSVAVDDTMFDDDTTICFEVSAWASATDTFSVDWCIDIPGIDGRGATAEFMAPSDGAIIACDTVALLFRLGDPGEIDPTTISITVDGVHLSYPYPERMEYSEPFLSCFIPSSELIEGVVDIALGDIHDFDGCPLVTDYEWNIFLDWHPPTSTVLSPSPGDTATHEDFEVLVQLDDISGVEDSSLYWIIDGTIWDFPVEFAGGIASIRPMETGLIPIGISPCEICLAGIHDKAYGPCGPNHSPQICVDFWTDIELPYAQIIEPFPGAWSSCDRQIIRTKIVNPGGEIDPSTVILTVAGVEYYIGAELSLDDTILTFVPPASFADGSTIDVVLVAGTSTHIAITPLSWSFNIDLSAPVIEPVSPGGGEFSSIDRSISFVISDIGAGVDISTLDITVEGPEGSRLLSATSPDLTISADTVIIYPGDIGLSLIGCNPISVEVDIADLAVLCGANVLSGFSWDIDVPCAPPIQSPPDVPEYSFISCETLSICFSIHDEDGINTDSMNISVNGIDVELGSDYARFEGDSFFFDLPRTVFAGDSVAISVENVMDIFYNAITDPISLVYYWDNEPPIIEDPIPDSSMELAGLPEKFSFAVLDDASGLDIAASFISFNSYRILESTGLEYDGSRISAPTDDLHPFTLDTIRVCVYAVDNSIGCGANIAFECLTYNIDRSPPTVELLSPPQDAILGCTDQRFEFYIFDEQGIDPLTVELNVCSETIDLTDAELTFDSCTLTFAPDSGYFSHGAVCNIMLMDVADSAGNHIDTPVGGAFTFDFEPPAVELVSPESVLRGPLQKVLWRIEDEPSGIDPASIVVEIDGAFYDLSHSALDLDGSNLVFNPEMAEPWDSDIEISLHVADLAFGCPNEGELLSNLTFDAAMPSIECVYPEAEAFVACDPIEVFAVISSEFGVVPDDATVSCDAVVLGYPDGIELCGDSLYAAFPESGLSDGWHEFVIAGLRDTLGNNFEQSRFGATLDFEPPTIEEIYPANGGNVQSEGLVISARVADDFAGVDLDLISMTINGLEYYLDSPYLQLLGDSLAMDASMLGLDGAVIVEVEAFDKTTSCGPNSTSRMWSFDVDGEGPGFELIEPFDGAITHIENQPIRIRITDSDGVNLDATSISIGGISYGASSGFTLDGDIVEFHPDFEWTSGRLYDISIYGEDALGNSSDAVLGGFITDFDPPEVVGTIPVDNEVLESPPDRVSIFVRDTISGFDPGSFELMIDGVAYSSGDIGFDADSAGIYIDLETIGIRPGSPDSMTVVLRSVRDYPGDYGFANIMEDAYTFSFTITDEGCVAVPRPFSPNGDGFYDAVTIFTGLSETAIIKIWTADGRPVREVHVDGKWDWDGCDDFGRPMPSGLYMFSVSRVSDRKTHCGGTAVLAR